MASREETPGSAPSRPRYSDRNDGPRERRDPRDNNPRNSGAGRRENNRSRSPHRGGGSNSNYRGGRRDDHSTRTRSRSPRRSDRDNTARPRSPPRGPRSTQQQHPRNTAPTSINGPASRNSTTQPPTHKPAPSAPQLLTAADLVPTDSTSELDADEVEMRKMMGFGGFKTTKNSKVPGNDKLFGVRRDKQTEYRQYMNRQGGFNRPLDAM